MRVVPEVLFSRIIQCLMEGMVMVLGFLAYLFDPHFAIFILCIRVVGVGTVCVLWKMARGAASADSIVEEHAVPLLDVSEVSDSPRLVGCTHIVSTGVDMQSDRVGCLIANVVSHTNLWDNCTYMHHEHHTY